MPRNPYDRDAEDSRAYYGGGRGGWGGADRRDDDERGAGRRGPVSRGSGYGYDDSYGAGGGNRGRDYESGDYARGNYEDRGGHGPEARGRYVYGHSPEEATRFQGRPDEGTRYGGYAGGGYEEGGYAERGGAYRRGPERDDERRSYGDEGGRGDYGRRGPSARRPARSRLRCRDIMTRDVTVARRDTTLEEVARLMKEEDTGIIPVVDDQAPADAAGAGGEAAGDEAAGNQRSQSGTRAGSHGYLVGLITDRDIVVRAIAAGRDARSTAAEEIMTRELHSAKPNDRVVDAIRTMGDKQVRRIPVVGESGQLRGIISMADIALETEEDDELAQALEEISSGSSFWGKIFG